MTVELHLGDCLEVMKGMPENSVDTCITDPPYELGFMGKKWDNTGVAFQPETWQAVYRVLKPGAILLAFGGTRTYHRMVCAIEDAGFEIRDTIAWVYGCLDAETHVATIDGVKPHHKTKIGDLVLCYNPENGEYSYQPILEIVEYEYSDTAYRLVGDLGEQVVSRNHRCIIERGGREVFELAETLQQQASVPFLESLPELRQAIHDGECNAVQDERRAQGIRAWRGHQTSMVRVVPFHYTGKVWCLRVPTGAFVAVRNGVAFPTGNSGFPKSYDISKGIDKQAGAEREVLRARTYEMTDGGGYSGNLNTSKPRLQSSEITAPSTPEAQLWHGWGTALKPAMELICVAMKPIDGTYVNNALTWGVAGFWIDGGRVGYEQGGDAASNPLYRKNNGYKTDYGVDENPTSYALKDEKGKMNINPQGRFPANLIHDGSDEVLECFPMTKSGLLAQGHKRGETSVNYTTGGGIVYRDYGNDSGSAARFFMSCKQDDLCFLCLTPKHSIMSDIDNSEVIRCKNISANNVEKSLTTTQATALNTAQESVQDLLLEKAVRFVKSAGNLCEKCATSIVREVVEIKTWDSKNAASQVIQDFIGNSNKCILIQSLAQYAEIWDSIDTTPTTTSLLKLFGCASHVITSYIQETEKTAPKRFLYSPKASRSERNAGLEGMEVGKRAGKMMHKANNTSDCPSDGFERFEPKPMQNHHPTVKPLALMRYLVRLTKTPTGGVVLDPFMGSGTTGCACALEGRDFIGIEREPAYMEIARRRIDAAQAQPQLI